MSSKKQQSNAAWTLCISRCSSGMVPFAASNISLAAGPRFNFWYFGFRDRRNLTRWHSAGSTTKRALLDAGRCLPCLTAGHPEACPIDYTNGRHPISPTHILQKSFSTPFGRGSSCPRKSSLSCCQECRISCVALPSQA